jgi:4-diphosphocytidyl-2-C-methyl-D-erythritol kinase
VRPNAADTWPAPAKINLFLHIVGRRADGYHLLQTVFQFLDYGDELAFEVSDTGEIARTRDLPGVTAEADLTLRAARLLKQATGCAKGVRITLTKRLPTGAGLGGGSSDAATTLIALNELWQTGLSIPALAALGLELGADVPVFVHGHAAWAEGVGEVLSPVDPPEPWYVVVVPPVHVSTAEIFGDFSRNRGLTPYTPPRTIRDLRAGQPGNDLARNDLERCVRKRYPEVERAFELLALREPGEGQPRMTGSGACVFLDVADVDAGKRILNKLPQGFNGFVARGMNRHPLSRRAAS